MIEKALGGGAGNGIMPVGEGGIVRREGPRLGHLQGHYIRVRVRVRVIGLELGS